MKKLLKVFGRSFLLFCLLILVVPWLALAVEVLFNFGELNRSEIMDTPGIVSVLLLMASPLVYGGWSLSTLGMNLSWLRQSPLSRTDLVRFNLLLGFFSLVASFLSVLLVFTIQTFMSPKITSFLSEDNYQFAWNYLFWAGILIPLVLSLWAFVFSFVTQKKTKLEASKHNLYLIFVFYVFLALGFYSLYKAFVSGHQLLGMLWVLIFPIALARTFTFSLALDVRTRKRLLAGVSAITFLPVTLSLLIVCWKIPHMNNQSIASVLHFEISLLASRLNKDQYRDFLRSTDSGFLFSLYKADYEDRFNKLSDDDFVSFLQNKNIGHAYNYAKAWDIGNLGSHAFRSYIIWIDAHSKDSWLGIFRDKSSNSIKRRNAQDVEWLLLAQNSELRRQGLVWSRYIQSERIIELLKDKERFLDAQFDLETSYKKTLAALAPMLHENRTISSQTSSICQSKDDNRYPSYCLRKWVMELGLYEEFFDEIEEEKSEWPLDFSSMSSAQKNLFNRIKEKKFQSNKNAI